MLAVLVDVTATATLKLCNWINCAKFFFGVGGWEKTFHSILMLRIPSRSRGFYLFIPYCILTPHVVRGRDTSSGDTFFI